MILKINFAEKSQRKEIINFFSKNISEKNDGIISDEFLCPFGISGAIDRKQIIIVTFSNEIIGGLRFYKRKTDNIVSLYQFALDERFRGKGLVKKMLKFSGYNIFESACFIGSDFNLYYKKQDWKIFKTDEKYNYWQLNLIQ